MTLTDMDSAGFADLIREKLPYAPTSQQMALIHTLADFCMAPLSAANEVFLLNGYAGTGKTSVVGALVKALAQVGRRSVLLAPTGRAAKVFSRFAGHPAYTIHRRIYHTDPDSGEFNSIAENTSRPGTVFIVDEASMIGSDNQATCTSLLDDLIEYVYMPGGCRLILLGDTAQLPPVGCTRSPAMSREVLRAFGLKVTRVVLTATVRQAAESGILYNATWLRKAMRVEPLPVPLLTIAPFTDVAALEGADVPDEISNAYSRYGIEETIVVTRSNKAATQYNLAIRGRILEREEMLVPGELVMIAKNNYYWTRKIKGFDFIANGDVARVSRVLGVEERGGMKFADVSLVFPDRDIEVEVKVSLDALVSDTPALSREQMQHLAEVAISDPERYPPFMPVERRLKMLRHDPLYNALQIKYAYAVTCHKSQGGQWDSVFVDMGYIPPEARGIDFYRWLYTSVTRAKKEVKFISPRLPLR